MRWLLAALVVVAVGCKGKSDDKARPPGATPTASNAVTGDVAAACVSALGSAARSGVADAVKACSPLCSTIGEYGAIKPAARLGTAKTLGLTSDALLTETSYVFMRAGRCLKIWYTAASDADKKQVATLVGAAPLELSTAARGYYRLAPSKAAGPVPAIAVFVVASAGQLNVVTPTRVQVTVTGASLHGGGFPGKTVALHQLAAEMARHKGMPIVLADATLPIARVASVVHAIGSPVALAVADGAALRVHALTLQPAPATTKAGTFLTWQGLQEALAAGKQPKQIYVRTGDERTPVSELVALMDTPALRQPGSALFVDNPTDANAPRLGGRARIDVGMVQAVGTKPALVKRAVAGIKAELTRCYATELAAKPNIKGTLVAIVHGGADGTVRTSRAKGLDRTLSTCVATELKKLHFGAHRADFRATVQLRFSSVHAPGK